MSLGLSVPTTPIRSSKSEGYVNGITPSYTLPSFPPPDTPVSGQPIQKREVKNPNPPLVYRGAGRSSRFRTPTKPSSPRASQDIKIVSSPSSLPTACTRSPGDSRPPSVRLSFDQPMLLTDRQHCVRTYSSCLL